MTDDQRDADEIRVELRDIDAEILGLLHRRARAARRAGALGRDELAAPPGSDRQALREIVARTPGDLPAESVREVFEAIFAACAHLDRPVRVAYAGAPCSPAHAAARSRFGASAAMGAFASSRAALEEVSRGRADVAVAAFETSSAGPVEATVEALLTSDLRIVEVLDVRPDVHLVNRTGRLDAVENVYLTPADRALCSKALAALGERIRMTEVATPALACELAIADANAAAVALELFAALAGLQVAQRDILDEATTHIRFAIVGSRPPGRSLTERTSFAFRPRESADAIVDALRILAEREVPLTRIHSLPVPREPWNYLFVAEARGHFTDRRLVMAFDELKRMTRSFRLLGSYPDPSEERAQP